MFTTSKKQRLLTEQDREWHLSIKQRAADPHASMRVIRMNSTYLELVDGYYANRGLMSIIGGGAVLLFLWMILSSWYSMVHDFFGGDGSASNDWSERIFYEIISDITLIIFSFIFVAFYRWAGEWFRYTHYPIRLNRRTRMVYVFRGDGTVLKASWDDVYFALRVNAQAAGIRTFGICGLVLKDPKTVEEMFVFGYASSSKENCLRHWEFIRRYMEEGPRAVL
ncbi:DUF6708 domain-containing protein, partial [Burkholderia sp. Ac-20344]|uniref:DUF6708 domain-containing protein n=1 Tax=Burkholderia sp. Ac-20344 TaxID=2703890 RepID=UPI001ED3C9B4|nr:hypothetical protein [Burkholderia sp. Ac-20344]